MRHKHATIAEDVHRTRSDRHCRMTCECLAGAVYGNEDRIHAQVARAVRGQSPFPVSPADALELSRILDAIRTPDAEDRIVNL